MKHKSGRRPGFTMSQEARDRIGAAQRERHRKLREAKAALAATNGHRSVPKDKRPPKALLNNLALKGARVELAELQRQCEILTIFIRGMEK